MGRSGSKYGFVQNDQQRSRLDPLSIGLKDFISLVFNRLGDNPQQYRAVLKAMDERTTEIEPGSGGCLSEDLPADTETTASGCWQYASDTIQNKTRALVSGFTVDQVTDLYVCVCRWIGV